MLGVGGCARLPENVGRTESFALSQNPSHTIILIGGILRHDQALLGGKHELAEERAREWMARYPGRFYLELHRTGRDGDETHLHAAVKLAQELQCPVVA